MMAQRISPQGGGFRLGLWIVTAGTTLSLVVGSSVLTFGMPSLRYALLVGSCALAIAATIAIRKGQNRLAALLLFPGYLVVLVPLLAFSTLVVRAASLQLFYGALLLDTLAIAAIWFGARTQGRGLWIALPALFALVHFSGAIGVLFNLSSAPDQKYCSTQQEQPGVFQVEADSQVGYGQQALMIPEEQAFAASFKVHHDLLLPGKEDIEANAVLIFKKSPDKNSYIRKGKPIRLPENQMPEFLLYDSRGHLVFTVIEYNGNHGIAVVTEPFSENPKIDHWIPLPHNFEPNALFEVDNKYVVVALHSEIAVIDPKTMKATDHWFRPDKGWLGGSVMLFATPNGQENLYLSTLGYKVLDLNLQTQKSRSLEIPWGGAGGIVHVLEGRNELVVVDMIFHNLIFINRETFTITRTHSLNFGPRAIAWAKEMNTLFVGSYLNGEVHALNINDLQNIGPPIRLGGNLRSLTYDTASNHLFANSKCGLLGVDLHEAFPNMD